MTRTHNPADKYVTCTRCGSHGHRGYHSRADARYVRKNHPDKNLTIFRCPFTDGLFHLGHTPTELAQGLVDRATMTEQKRSAARRRTDERENR